LFTAKAAHDRIAAHPAKKAPAPARSKKASASASIEALK
jgi:hypothetical protein